MSVTPGPALTPEPPARASSASPTPPSSRGLEWVFFGPSGLRAGWSILFAYCLFYLFRLVLGTFVTAFGLVGDSNDLTPGYVALVESIPFVAMIGAGILIALVERRRLFDYNLTGPRPAFHFFLGFAAGFLALSALVGALRVGGWLRFSPDTLTGADVLRFAALWAFAYLLVGCVEEGLFRCYLQFTLTRGLNFWWAFALEAALCLYAFANAGNDAPGVYLVAALGLFPCFALHQKAAARGAFWQAAWVTSTLFGLIHTFNGGENSMGIFAAACIGFVFCVSVRVTGSAWWAIGCHAAWDWSESYFYGTANSGLAARGHLLTSAPFGNPLLSGGADGPEGSVLVLGAIGLLLVLLIVFHARRAPAAPPHRELAAD
jgi:membrane protease YdiL (CAAX protease family)